MNKLLSYKNYVNQNSVNESKLQEDYRELFSVLLKKYKVKSPAKFKTEPEKAEKFYGELKSYWVKGEGLSKSGKKFMEEEGKQLLNEKYERDVEDMDDVMVDDEYMDKRHYVDDDDESVGHYDDNVVDYNDMEDEDIPMTTTQKANRVKKSIPSERWDDGVNKFIQFIQDKEENITTYVSKSDTINLLGAEGLDVDELISIVDEFNSQGNGFEAELDPELLTVCISPENSEDEEEENDTEE